MDPQPVFYSTLLFTAALISIAIVIATWTQRRTVSGGYAFTLMMLALIFWSLTYAIHWTQAYRPSEFFWLDTTYLGVVLVPLGFLAFSLEYTHRQHWLTNRTVALLTIEPVVTLLLLWTDNYHGLFFGGKRISGMSAILTGGPWFWFHILYSYTLIAIGFYLIVRAFLHAPRLYRGQASMLLIGSLIPWAGSAIGLANLSPFPNLDLTPIAFTFTGIAFTIALFYYGLLDIVPVARDTLVENMSDGMLVLDAQRRVVDINPAALQLIGWGNQSPIGQPSTTVLAAWPHLVARLQHLEEGQEEILVAEEPPLYFDLRITRLQGRDGNFAGHLIVLRDITDRKGAEIALVQANKVLQARLVEIEELQTKLREQVIRDPLTGLFNRRYLEVTLERELANAQRDGTPISLAIMDIDHFKEFNDTYGHKAGDLMLQALAEMLRKQTRSGDVPCRYGGEEFLVVLPNASLEAARERAEQWRGSFEALRVYSGHELLQTTLSFGIAAYPQHGQSGDEVIQAADKALYAAKAAGRNCVAVYTPD